MKWYIAHLVEYAKFHDGVQDYYPFYENVGLIQADSPEEAWTKAEQFGRENEFDDTSLTWNDRPAQMVFAGVRKVITPSMNEESDRGLKHGTELTYSLMVIDRDEGFHNFLNNQPADVRYEE
jgi:Domain of unknown function (DUF4288)